VTAGDARARERLAFAGFEAHVGVLVFGLFLLLGVLAVVGVGALIIIGEVHPSAGELATYVGGVLVVGLWGYLTVRDLRNVRLVIVEPDGTWRLRGPLGIPRGTLAPEAPRTVHAHERQQGSYFGVIRYYQIAWAEIEAGGRRWRTCRSIPSANARTIARLAELARG
jgi:hypothetical protein